jgi:hypothetical protein
VNDAIGGATSGTLSLSQTAIGGNGSAGGNATSTLIGTNPFGAATYNLTANAIGGNGNGNEGGGIAGARVDARTFPGGIVNATANAKGGSDLVGLTGAAGAAATAIIGSSISTAIGTANATATATTGNRRPDESGNGAGASAQAFGSNGRSLSTAHTNFGNFTSVETTSISPTSPLGGNTFAQAGGTLGPTFIPLLGSTSAVSGSGFGPLTVANGSMGAGYGGTGSPLTYQQSANFRQTGGTFVLDLVSNAARGNGFDSALFTISLNSVVIDSQSFTDLASAEAFFSNHLIGVPLFTGSNSILIAFSETMSGTEPSIPPNRPSKGLFSTTLSRAMFL